MIKDYRYAVIHQVLGSLYYIIRAYSWTFRLEIANENPWMEYLQQGGRVLICCWHQQFFSAIRYFKTYAHLHPALMISKSKDGDIIADIANKTGWRTVRGSSSRDGRRALQEMVDHLDRFRFAAHVLDGPRGPAGIVKAGVISLARATGARVVPLYASADRAWYFHSWDRFMLPKPFAHVCLRFGDMLDVSAGEGEEAFEFQRLRLQHIMQPGLG